MTDSAALAGFLLRAKRATYAAQGDDATVTPLLPGSRQLEYREGGLFYRDVYFGVASFAGLETVDEADVPRWSMAYAGGMLAGASPTQMREVYAFLRNALNRGTLDNAWRGSVDDFSGTELIRRDGAIVYRLTYAGGRVR